MKEHTQDTSTQDIGDDTGTPINLNVDSVTHQLSTRKPLLDMLWRSLPLLMVGLSLLILSLLILSYGQFELWKWLEELHWFWSLLVFILLFTMVSFPFGFGYVILNMACGYLYGFVQGQFIVMVSVTTGFSLAFVTCRSLLKEHARNVVDSNTTLKAVLHVIDGPNGFKIIFLTRLTPIPFGLQTVMFAVS